MLHPSPEIVRQIERLRDIAGRDPGNRGIAPLLAATTDDLLSAARCLAEHPAPHVAILTGFYIPTADPPAAENDGPIGAAHLAAALERAGIPARLCTDEPCRGAVRAAARAAGHAGALDVVGLAPEGQVGSDLENGDLAAVLRSWECAAPPVSHVVSIERVGPAAGGVCRNMKGDDISAWTAPFDQLFLPDQGRVRIGIGDGGNELGMGKLPPELVKTSIPHGELTACVTDCDHLLVCGVSNWGSLALVAALALLRPDLRSGLTAGLSVERDRRVLEATVHEGPAVDGMLKRSALSVDDLPWKIHAEVLQDLLQVLAR